MQRIEFRVLGPLEVVVEGRALELKRRKQRSLLALLLLRAGEVVSTDSLVEELWAGRPPKAAVGSLQNLVSELRKQLGSETVETRSPGYRLAVDPDRVDLHRFERLVALAGETEEAGRRSSLLREALGLWRGPALADLVLEPFAQIEIGRLEEQRTAAREDLLDAELELGRHGQLVAELEALVSEHPLRERLRGQLMLALYRSGRQAEALEAYRAARETLVEELGIEPSPDLQQLEQAILRHDQELDLPARVAIPAPEPDRRKTVTVLFTDVVDSTSLGAALDPEVTRAVMRRYFDTVRTLVERHGGTVEKFIGDAALAAFGFPKQHEDDALRAVRTAEELRQAITGLNADLERDHGVAIQIRTAINTGEVVSGDPASGQPFATGSAVNIAMRLHEAALPAEILLGPATHRLVREATATEPVEPVELGSLGRIAPHRLVFLTETAGLRPLGHAPLVGRQDELARLRGAFDQVRAESHSRVVTVLGDAGVGKSRLVKEFASLLGDEARFVVGRCLSYGEGATYLPLVEIVRQLAPKRPRSTIASLLVGDEDAELIATRLTELSGESEGGSSTGELFWAVRRLFEAVAVERPLVVVLEDIHWAEPTLLDLVEYLDSWIADAPVLVLCLARPTLLEERAGWGRSASAETISLQPLSADESAELVAELAGERELSEAVRARIVAVAEGNALFVEQLHAYLTEDVEPDEVESVPPSIEALLASRLDTLETGERMLIERGAVIGRDFARNAVMHLTPPKELAGLDQRLAILERRGLVRALRGRPGEESLRFHHVLIRDVAYAGITKDIRADLHERHGTWLDQQSEAEELVGYHAERAHNYRKELRPGDPALPRLAVWAGDRLASAGIRAWKRADTPAAVNLLGRGAALLPVERQGRAELLCELGVAQRWAGDFKAADRTLVDAIEAASSTNERRLELRAQIEHAHIRLFTDRAGASAELLELAEKAIPVFEELGDDRALARTWRHIGYIHGTSGRLASWEEAAESALVYYRRSGWSTSGCLSDVTAALFYGPTPVADAIRRAEELLEEASDRAGRANVLASLGGLRGLSGSLDEARQLIGEAEATYEELGEAYALANNSGRLLARLELLAGEGAAAEAASRRCCETFERIRDEAGLSTQAAELADALYVQGRYEDAAGWARLAKEHAVADDKSGQFGWRRVSAKLLAHEGQLEEAQRLANEALTIVSATDDLTGRGMVLVDLAQVLVLAKRPREAAPHVERALALFERKGNVLSMDSARSLLTELAVA
jgi:DNA-binding SARP family transcriptional activator